jgi:hypothetical protein
MAFPKGNASTIVVVINVRARRKDLYSSLFIAYENLERKGARQTSPK